jgi:hypothetical protein
MVEAARRGLVSLLKLYIATAMWLITKYSYVANVLSINQETEI